MCQSAERLARTSLRYLELDIDSQRLRDPVFDGKYFINLGTDFPNFTTSLRIFHGVGHADGHHYASTVYEAPVIWIGGI